MVRTVAPREHETQRKTIYNRYPRGWCRDKMLALQEFSGETGYDWRCIQSADCKDWIGPDGYERCANCLGIV